MSRHSITLRRSGVRGFLSDQSIGTDAINALLGIKGVENPEIVDESNEQVELTYTWSGDDKFWETSQHLERFGLVRVE